MLISIELHDKSPQGKRLGKSAIVMTSCRVFRQSGDGIRLNNLAPAVQQFYQAATVALLHRDPASVIPEQLGHGTYPVVVENLERFRKAGTEQ